MSLLSKNIELYNYLKENYSTTHYRFKKIFGHLFPYKKLDLGSISELKLDGVQNLSGIEELKGLTNLEVKGASNLAPIEECSNLSSVKCILPDTMMDTSILERISKMECMRNAEFYGRGVKSITSEQALNFGESSKISYEQSSKLNLKQFSQVQKRLEEIQSLITPEMTDIQKVETIYGNLLSQDFQYDYENDTSKSNGYLINDTMYGPLVENKGVCSGVASALATALQNAGLDAVACGGWADKKVSAGNAHQWNQVKVDNEWYNLDLTNDFDKESWHFFMKSDNNRDWAECHYVDKEDKSEPIHDCTSTKYDIIYRENPMQCKLRDQKEKELKQQKINTPSKIDNQVNQVNHEQDEIMR